ncbi:asparagine synthase (glutamine-hydrolyzing) [Patescibacteria group bacterium]|nr:MAG: asparagine synthase (glutamine-hydrolyzing) [Patescibacteria group bacterium]
MCGINGFNWKDEKLIRRMNEITRHRGPDAAGFYCDDLVSLGNNRLSIIDLDPRANQPMTGEDGRFVIVYNGEIYNFEDIRRELSDYPFKTKSDTEVILAAYEKWGKESFRKLNGMYAFAIWDKKEKELVLARDPVGVKPLLYYFNQKKFIFSSEIKAILLHEDVLREVDPLAVAAFFRILYTPAPLTGFSKIQKLLPGHYISWRGGNITIKKFFQWGAGNAVMSREETLDTVKKLIFKAVKRQLVSDRPLGLYLSGGLDSTTVLHAMSKVTENIETFSVGFRLSNKAEEEKFNQDFLIAKKVAAHYRTNHHAVEITPDDVASSLEEAVAGRDDPISNPTAIPMLFLANFTKKFVTVALSGDGGDELFGGYERYRYAKLAESFQKVAGFAGLITPILGGRAKKLLVKPGIDQFKLFMFQKDTDFDGVFKQRTLLSEDDVVKFFQKNIFENLLWQSGPDMLMRADFESWLPDQALALADTMSMMASLEQRVPLLDLPLAQFLLSIPASRKISFRTNKRLIREAFAKDLPDFLFRQPKRGWFAPGAKWLREPKVLSVVRLILSEGYNSQTGKIFNWPRINVLLDDHMAKRGYHLNLIWAILTFQIWARKYNVSC